MHRVWNLLLLLPSPLYTRNEIRKCKWQYVYRQNYAYVLHPTHGIKILYNVYPSTSTTIIKKYIFHSKWKKAARNQITRWKNDNEYKTVKRKSMLVHVENIAAENQMKSHILYVRREWNDDNTCRKMEKFALKMDENENDSQSRLKPLNWCVQKNVRFLPP